MKIRQLSCVVGATAAIAVAAAWRVAEIQPVAAPPTFVAASSAMVAARFAAVPINTTVVAKASTMSPSELIGAAFGALGRYALMSLDVTAALPEGPALALTEDDASQQVGAALPTGAAAAARRTLPYLKYYVYSELPPPEKPANIALHALSDIPLGTPIEEIKRAADAFDLDFNFMKAVAKVESNFDPRERTGSYIGLFQLSRAEFNRYGSGDITNPRDNAVAAAYKFLNEAAMFEAVTHKKPTFSDLYLIHQQGWQGAAEHVSHPDRIAWKSMCATDEGMMKGERWCKEAIWWNTLPSVKREWKSVDRLTSGAFVAMWRERIDTLYARYADAPSRRTSDITE
jgi:hypothetical protein